MTFFYFLPSILLSGFMFPFRGMPGWAQVLGEILPLTHFLRVVRGIMLKGDGFPEIAPNVWPLVAFWIGVGTRSQWCGIGGHWIRSRARRNRAADCRSGPISDGDSRRLTHWRGPAKELLSLSGAWCRSAKRASE